MAAGAVQPWGSVSTHRYGARVAVAGFIVGLIGVLFAGFTLWRSEAWHRQDSTAADEALRVAKAVADAQERLAGRDPWRVMRIGSTHGVQLTNETGAAAINVDLGVTGPWAFWDGMANDPNRLLQQSSLAETCIERVSSVRHEVSLIDPPEVAVPGWSPPAGELRVTWSDNSGKRETWTWPLLSIFEDGGVSRLS